MTEFERESFYRDMLQDTDSMKKIYEKEKDISLVKGIKIRKAKRVFASSNVPVEERHSTLSDGVRALALLLTSSTLLFLQGTFR